MIRTKSTWLRILQADQRGFKKDLIVWGDAHNHIVEVISNKLSKKPDDQLAHEVFETYKAWLIAESAYNNTPGNRSFDICMNLFRIINETPHLAVPALSTLKTAVQLKNIESNALTYIFEELKKLACKDPKLTIHILPILKTGINSKENDDLSSYAAYQLAKMIAITNPKLHVIIDISSKQKGEKRFPDHNPANLVKTIVTWRGPTGKNPQQRKEAKQNNGS